MGLCVWALLRSNLPVYRGFPLWRVCVAIVGLSIKALLLHSFRVEVFLSGGVYYKGAALQSFAGAFLCCGGCESVRTCASKATCSQVYRTYWWMGAYGSPTPKRSKAFSNNPVCAKYNTGCLIRAKDLGAKALKTATVGYSKFGKKTCTGTKALKSSQLLDI